MPDKEHRFVGMPGRRTLYEVCCCMLFIVMFDTSCAGNGIEKSDTLYYLDANKRSIAQPIEPKDMAQEEHKFVQIEVTKVLNPKKYFLTFEVHYQLESNVKIYLGSFSLYPSDNPGKFIVATQGKLKNEGAIILSLVMPDNFDPKDTIKVTVKRMKLLKE